MISYQFYVGDGVRNVGDVKGNFVRLNPHLNDGRYFGNSVVTDICKPGDTSKWCGALPTPQIDDKGILTVTLDQRAIAAGLQRRDARGLRALHAARSVLLRRRQQALRGLRLDHRDEARGQLHPPAATSWARTSRR